MVLNKCQVFCRNYCCIHLFRTRTINIEELAKYNLLYYVLHVCIYGKKIINIRNNKKMN